MDPLVVPLVSAILVYQGSAWEHLDVSLRLLSSFAPSTGWEMAPHTAGCDDQQKSNA